MPCTLNRKAFQKLINENIEAMEKMKQYFIDNDVRLEWDHIVSCLQHTTDLHYGREDH